MEGVDPIERAVITIANNNNVVVAWDAQRPVTALLSDAACILKATASNAAIFSMAYLSTHPSLVASNKALPQPEVKVREPAVSGAFYPASDAERDSQVEQLIAPYKQIEAKPALAIMTPHAGLRYSGNVAANVWSSIHIPSRLLIIGPKHTSHGVELAIAPYESWKLSNTVQFAGDLDWTQKLAKHLSGFQLDARAHQREHGIEVQLPLLKHLARDTKLSSIAMASIGWDAIASAAGQLASLLQSEADPPLLVISSDMNHFASDQENKRRDMLALDAIQSKDPQKLLQVCRENQISMCGVIPAALVMQTLLEIGKPFEVEELAYETSADAMRRAVANGESDAIVDNDRVVGYAGLVFRETIPA